MNQRSLEGSEIFPAIIVELEKSKHEILVVSAWFTDEDLFNILLNKQQLGVRVKIIIAQNEINERIDFSKLIDAGGKVIKKENNGIGMMHKKYCIIDEKVVIHGSYNWTNNARKNNQESIIITDHKDTIQELRNSFMNMEKEIVGITEKENTDSFKLKEMKNGVLNFFKKNKTKKKDGNKAVNSGENHHLKDDFGKNIDTEFSTIISTEVKNINREEVKILGKTSARNVNGDEGVLRKSMDSLYQIFISDINQVSEKKKAVKNKIDLKAEELFANFELDKNIEKEHQKTIYFEEESELKRQLAELEGKKKLNDNKLDFIENTVIHDLKQKTENLKEATNNLQVEFVKPKIKYFELIPKLIALTGLSIALFLFYSSSAYIMLYAKDDALQMLKNGIQPIAQVFNSHAFILAGQKTGTAVYYIIAFVFIPFGIALATYNTKKIWRYLSILPVLILDGFVAYKVSNTINEIKYLSDGSINNEAFYLDPNLWIIFLLSLMPFIFFEILLNSTLSIFESRHPQAGKEKMEFLVKKNNEKITTIETQITEEQNKKQQIKTDLIEIDNKTNDLNIQLSNLSINNLNKLKVIEETYNGKIRLVKSKADIYKNNIDNDNIPISQSALKDRVSVFLEGWNEWLHEEFSVIKAIKYSESAREEADSWLSDNITEGQTRYSLKKAS